VLLDQPSLYAAVDAQRQRLGMSWADVAREVQVATSTIKRLQSGTAAEADGILGLVRWLRQAPEDFAGSRSSSRRPIGPGRLNTQKLFTSMDARRVTQGMSWADVAQYVAGGSPAGLRNLARGGRIGIDTLMTCLDWLELPAADFVDPAFEHPGEVTRIAARGN
jgi:hypothetical protein